MIEDILRAVLGLPPGEKKINRDLAEMRQVTWPLMEQVIPWEEEKELELMALKMDLKSQKQGMDRIQYGTVQSIYFEPMVAFAYKDYMKGSREGLLYCRTVHMELVYRIRKSDIEVYLNGHQVAVITQENILYGVKSRKPLGKVRPYSADLLSIVVWDREVGHLFNPLRPHSDVQRAFYMLADLNDEELGVFMAMGLYELVMRLMANKKKK